MQVVAYRGNTPLKDEGELRAHLASLIRLENVGFLLGAGCSVSEGGKTIAGLWQDFEKQFPDSLRWLKQENFINEELPNIERLFDTLEISLQEWTRVNDTKLEKAKSVKADLFRAIIKASELDASYWSGNTSYENPDSLKFHKQILQKIISARQPGQASPWVFTTNYDLAVEWAAEAINLQVINGFSGFHRKKFSPQSFDLGFRNTQARGEARFGTYNIYLAKLHGSLTWHNKDSHLYEMQAGHVKSDIDNFINKETDDFGYLVMPSAAKYLQTVGFVLGELLRRFSEFLAKPQTSLVVSGYGFGDEHINRLIISALYNPTLQVVIYLPEISDISDTTSLPDTVKMLISLQNPRVTIVGGGSGAYFNKLSEHLPDPAIYDDNLHELEKRIREAHSKEDERGIGD